MEAGETTRSSGTESPGRPAGRSAIYSVELEVFEGPLDLLLHLVRRHELEILDIPIAFITEKYLEYLDFMRSLDLEVAGDYLVMAATLAYLKSRELLPSDPLPSEGGDGDDEDAEDPREALIRRLVEYERFKNAAADLDALPVSGRDVFARGADIDVPPIDPGLAPVTLFRLAEAYYRVLTRAKINKSHEVQLEPVTVAQRMTQLTLLLDQKQSFDFEGLFLGRTWSSERELRGMLVVTLMSVLELVKLGVARVQQIQDSESIRIYRLEASEEARALIETYDEAESFGDAGRPPPPPSPIPSDAELDAAEESALLAEALAGADDTDLGPDAGTSPAANSPTAADAARMDAEDVTPDEALVDANREPADEPLEVADADREPADSPEEALVDADREPADQPDETLADADSPEEALALADREPADEPLEEALADADREPAAEPDAALADADRESADEPDAALADADREPADEPLDEALADADREPADEPPGVGTEGLANEPEAPADEPETPADDQPADAESGDEPEALAAADESAAGEDAPADPGQENEA